MVGSPLSSSNWTNIEAISVPLRPLWTIQDMKDKDEVLKWMKSARLACEEFYQGVFQVQMDNLLIYKGIQWLNQDKTSNRFLDRNGGATRKSPKVVINDISDYVEQWVSRLTRYKPAVSINPTNNEWSDVQDAKVSKHVLDHIWYERRVDPFFQELIRQAKIFGESYMWVTWNPQLGDLHPDSVEARKTQQRVALRNAAGEEVMDAEGKPILIDKAVRIGDVDYTIQAPWHVWDMPCRNRQNIDWSIRWYVEDIEVLKAKYPESAKDIKGNDSTNIFETYRLDVGKLKNEVVVYELFHRGTEFLDKGRYIKCTEDALLESTDLPYNHGQIPYVRFSDIDIPDDIRGMSFIQNVFPIAFQKNALYSLIYKSAVLTAHPKWIAPDGAVEVQQLADQSTVVSYQGGVPPQLVNTGSIPMELFTHIKALDEAENKLAGIYGMSRGEVPAGVRAGAALRVLEEQEDKRAYILNTKFYAVVVDVARMTLAVAGDYYDDSDGRMARVVGKGNSYLIKSFNSANLSKSYDIRIQNTSALSQSPSGRIQDIIDLSQLQLNGEEGQGIFTKQEVVDFLDLEANEKMKDIATEAVRCAESENQDILEGLEVEEPFKAEDLIAHWRVHRRPMQSRTYKSLVPQERRDALEIHLLATEYLMIEKARLNPAFAAKLSLESDFPCLFEMPDPMMAPQPQMPMPGGQVMPEGGMQTDPATEADVLEPQVLESQDPTAPPPLAEEQPAPPSQ